MATDRVTISAGGRDFVTSLSTLKSSGAGYFEALLGPTGRSMKGRKRARADDDESRELFVDRDPDLFAGVLAFCARRFRRDANGRGAARGPEGRSGVPHDDPRDVCTEAVALSSLRSRRQRQHWSQSLMHERTGAGHTIGGFRSQGPGPVPSFGDDRGPGSTAHHSKTEKQKEDETAVGSYLTFSATART